MKFSDVPSTTAIFLDANVFVYNFTADLVYGPFCRSLLERIEQHDLRGFISSHVLNDVAYRLMTIEASQTFGWPYAGINRQLRNHPEEISKLHLYQQAINEITSIGIQVLPVTAQEVAQAAALSIKFGLLSGDALIVSIMQSNNLIHIASNDSDFDRVAGITRYAPC